MILIQSFIGSIMVTDNLVKKGWFTATFRLQICSQLIILIYLIN